METKDKPGQLTIPDKLNISIGPKKTRDYSQFKFIDRNRTIKKVHVERLMESIQRNNRMEWKPILVNEKMEVLDGQHRLKAAEKLGADVYYQVVKGDKTSDLNDLQVAMSWGLDDHFHSWVSAGYPDYIKLKNFMQKHYLTVGKALSLFGEYKNKSWYEDFRQGNFKFCKEFEDLDENVKNIKEIINYISMKTSGNKRYLKATNFWCALSTFLNVKEVDFKTFMYKLEYKLDLMRPSTKISEYMMIFKTIYNWKNREPIE